MLRRLLTAGVAAALVAGSAGAAIADEPVQDLILEGSAADYHGRGVVLTAWAGDTAAAVFTVTRSDGMSMVTAAGGTLAVGSGTVARHDGESWYGTSIVDAAPWEVSDRYTLREAGTVTQLDRVARQVIVLENGFPRVRITVDDETSVPLRTEVLDGTGRVFRASFLTEMSSMSAISGVQQRSAEGPMPRTVDSKEMAPGVGSDRLPETLGAYERADVYEAPGGGTHAYYTDGLFAFSVFEYPRAATPNAFDRAGDIELDGHRYRRIVEPSQIWLQWNAPDHGYVLVGDLPPDHLNSVVAELPDPGDRGILVRFWRRLFG